MTKKQRFLFETRLVEYDNTLVNTVVELPADVVKKLPKGRVRVEGKLNEVSFNLGVQSKKSGARYLSISQAMRKAAKIKPGDKVKVMFNLVDPDKLELPEEMEAVLAQDEAGAKLWNKLTVGLQRSLVHYINSTKNIDLRIERALYLMNKVKSGAYNSRMKKE
ncbi:MAG TPA: YdeI/OmpD-associated family protein [Cyclobacteriaceae bacterium]|jgi:translation initiation factor IF-1|nr:YdeI/OmpD-associated family protein [Cyclobacteriaceae bacterium]HRF32235.1 YdeI/OmpD-associated family protein [Cyclobacteriaceae bacterium]